MTRARRELTPMRGNKKRIGVKDVVREWKDYDGSDDEVDRDGVAALVSESFRKKKRRAKNVNFLAKL